MAALPKELPPTRMTVEEFLAWPGDERYELVDGELRAMSPASDAHGTIQGNIGALIHRCLLANRPGCRMVMNPGVMPMVRAHINMRIPDVAVTCTPNLPAQHGIPDPLLIVEILSPTNERDTWHNVWSYVTIPTAMEVLILHSARIEAQLLRRQPDGSWPSNPALIGAHEALRLDSIGLDVPLRDVYAGTYLAAQR